MSDSNIEDVMERVERQVDWWKRQVKQAEEYRDQHPSPVVCLAVAGLPEGNALAFEAPPGFTFRPVEHPPGEVALARGVKRAHLFGAIGRYMPAVHYELAIPLKDGELDTLNEALNYGWLFFTALRIKSNADILVPAALDCSWNALAVYDDQSRIVVQLEDAPRAVRKTKDYPVTLEDLQWAAAHVEKLQPYWELPGFRLATECGSPGVRGVLARYAIR